MMRRLPSGHRTVSVLEFNGKWKMPEGLAKNLARATSPTPWISCVVEKREVS